MKGIIYKGVVTGKSTMFDKHLGTSNSKPEAAIRLSVYQNQKRPRAVRGPLEQSCGHRKPVCGVCVFGEQGYKYVHLAFLSLFLSAGFSHCLNQKRRSQKSTQFFKNQAPKNTRKRKVVGGPRGAKREYRAQ